MRRLAASATTPSPLAAKKTRPLSIRLLVRREIACQRFLLIQSFIALLMTLPVCTVPNS